MSLTEVDLSEILEYAQCPNFSKYNVANRNDELHHHVYYQPFRRVILSCYEDLANLEKKVKWRTVRNRIHSNFMPLIRTEGFTIDDYMKTAKTCMQQLRDWYLSSFRSGPTTCLQNIDLVGRVPAIGVNVRANVDVITLTPDHIRILEVTDKFKTKSEAFNSPELRVKAWILGTHNIRVNELSVISIHGSKINVWTQYINNWNEFMKRTENFVKLTVGGIKQNVYYPSITPMCNTCAYKKICSW